MKAYPFALVLTLLVGCTSSNVPQQSASQTSLSERASTEQNAALKSFYDYQLYTPSGKALNLDNLPSELLEADVILVGEWHTHSGIHRFQTDLLKALALENESFALSMEQFTRDNQSVVDEYLASEIGEQTLIKQGGGWPNYESDYRPLVELAKQANLPIIASNAPKPIVRCIGRQGLDYLDKLDDEKRALVAAQIDTSSSPYKDKFMASMHHGDKAQTERQYAAQLTWDATMAESIVNYLNQHNNSQILHVAGKFHIEQGLGTAAQIQSLTPELNVVVISPVTSVSDDSTDYQLHVLEPPVRFVKQENRMKAYQGLHKRNDTLTCD